MQFKSRILICGGREFADQALFDNTMDICSKWFSELYCIIQGQARGADRMAAIWAHNKGCPMIAIPANWDYYDKYAGTKRNEWMLEFAKPDLVIAFPGGRGTAHMVRIARAAGVDVYEVR